MRFTYEPYVQLVIMTVNGEYVDVMTLDEYTRAFGFAAAASVAREK